DDIDGNVRQAKELEKAGCEILRVSIPDKQSVRLIEAIKNEISIPLVADIHFDYRLAIESAEAGIDKIRINPGNIGDMDKVRQLSSICKSRNIPIRIGVNSGSLEKEILEKYNSPTPEALVESALNHVKMLTQFDFDQIVVSIKSSDVNTMIKSYRLMAEKCDFPLHLGVTEAGTERMGLIKSSIGIGSLLTDGIGETIRVSLTADPVKEIYAAQDILKSIGKSEGVQIVSCPTCGRTRIDIVSLANIIEDTLKDCKKNIKVAVMGCAVNGPGEAREADVGIAGGDGCALLFKKGEIIKKVPENDIIIELMKEIEKL
ncbi:MAG TPA: flavodoxin-dependent (E)-4-hydroxy-3-methylbut-2-enyl-diphosphate synthase, partial [Oscillospiraceae bacterium]|nr:flavodoxin-dependent (E)-4-hydroxy-3-methylbut-2-enyl-diphosphate synthase [Oscillospiraceae bacterium]